MQPALKSDRYDDAAPAEGLCWFSAFGRPQPVMLHPLNATAVGDPAQIGAGAVCFAAVEAGSLGVELVNLRAVHRETIYVIAVVSEELEPSLQAALFAAGADDVLVGSDLRQLVPCLMRAKRHLELRRHNESWQRSMQEKLDIWQEGLDHLPTPIYVKDADGRYLVCNAAFGQFLGVGHEQILGRRLQDFLPPGSAEAYHESDLQLLRQGGVMRSETDVCLPEAGIRHIMVHKARLDSRKGDARGLAGVVIDITERKELEARLTEAAERDPLTNAANRRKFFEVASSEIALASPGDVLAVAVIDIDNFKSINDELGHAEGDITLCSIVDTLRTQEAGGMLVARAGGEEFFAFFTKEVAPAASDMLELARQDIARYCQVHTGVGAAGTISIGLAFFKPLDETIDQALRRADLALYRAKRDGRNRICLAE
ncbi:MULTISPECIES: GGDEF domain-containing protein [unclassified Rhizobium]|uniref:GGDEF domain-containing protein n=1 Tax=unclassified Rhizobium TaxID=2613769 RepID=UPI000ACEED7F|nr:MULTISPECIES: GGDEF domain-containing protein [unclassified Rhizobium]